MENKPKESPESSARKSFANRAKKVFKEIPNAIFIISALSTLAKLKTWKDFLTWMEAIKLDIFEILDFIGRSVNWLLTPWRTFTDFIFSYVPIRLPDYWHDPVIIGGMSMWQGYMIWVNGYEKRQHKKLLSQLDELIRIFQVPPEEVKKELVSNILKIIGLDPTNLGTMLIGPPQNYLWLLKEGKLSQNIEYFRLEALSYTRELRKNYAEKGLELRDLNKYDWIDKVIWVVIILLMIDYMRDGVPSDAIFVFFRVIAASLIMSAIPFLLLGAFLVLVLVVLFPSIKLINFLYKRIKGSKLDKFIGKSLFRFLKWAVEQQRKSKNPILPSTWGNSLLFEDFKIKKGIKANLPKSFYYLDRSLQPKIEKIYMDALIAFQEKNYKDCLEKMKQINACFIDANILSFISVCQYQLKNYTGALYTDKKRCILDPVFQENEFNYNSGLILTRLGRLTEAEVALKTMEKQNPEHKRNTVALALLYKEKRNKPQCLYYLGKAYSLGYEMSLNTEKEFGEYLGKDPRFLKILEMNQEKK